ncbi:MAG: hypothetical protein M1829_001461 [Trizodia sp. TS-e1964]|nr:MAG: hypothetical protein M1829_001461 [Trizodia sp. TS-e1964]
MKLSAILTFSVLSISITATPLEGYPYPIEGGSSPPRRKIGAQVPVKRSVEMITLNTIEGVKIEVQRTTTAIALENAHVVFKNALARITAVYQVNPELNTLPDNAPQEGSKQKSPQAQGQKEYFAKVQQDFSDALVAVYEARTNFLLDTTNPGVGRVRLANHQIETEMKGVESNLANLQRQDLRGADYDAAFAQYEYAQKLLAGIQGLKDHICQEPGNRNLKGCREPRRSNS